MLARNVLEHGLPQVDLTAFQNDGEREQRHEHQWDKECGHGLRDGVQREVQEGAIGSAKDQIMVAVVRVEAGEQALPQHVETGRAQAQKRAAGYHQCLSDAVQVYGSDKAAPAKQVWRACEHHHEAARRPREVVHSDSAGEIAQREHERLHQEEPEHDLRGLEVHGQKREHAAPYAGCVDGKE